MIDFLKRLFGQTNSSATAKERLRLVLMTDHLELAPEMIDAMKRELVDVISKFVEVDRDKIEVNFERHDRALAMLANIPILSVNRPNGESTVAVPVPQAPELAAQATPVAAPEPVEDASATETEAAAVPAAPAVRKRRRRSGKKAAAKGAAPAPLPAH